MTIAAYKQANDRPAAHIQHILHALRDENCHWQVCPCRTTWELHVGRVVYTDDWTPIAVIQRVQGATNKNLHTLVPFVPAEGMSRKAYNIVEQHIADFFQMI